MDNRILRVTNPRNVPAPIGIAHCFAVSASNYNGLGDSVGDTFAIDIDNSSDNSIDDRIDGRLDDCINERLNNSIGDRVDDSIDDRLDDSIDGRVDGPFAINFSVFLL
jgi:hypothetical protein